jgi:hypothetical protein
MKSQFIFLLALLSSGILFAQDSMLSNFKVDVNNGKVLLSWIINAGNTCNGIQIFRSEDSLSFYEIGEIPGVCGDLSSSKNYFFTDNEPIKNAKNYYKLDLGGQEYSGVLSIEVIDLRFNEVLVRPNPADTYTNLILSNDNNQSIVISIFELSGSLKEVITTNQSEVMLTTANWREGLYYFQVVHPSHNKPFSGKFVVVH